MTSPVSARQGIGKLERYHSPQVDAEVRLNTNEAPEPPPSEWFEAMEKALRFESFNRYPDREVKALRTAIANRHGVTPEEIFCANGSNEVLQSLLLGFGGPGRSAVMFSPTYLLHSHISRLTMTEVVEGVRDESFLIDLELAKNTIESHTSDVVFVCSPNNPTGLSEPKETVEELLEIAPGLVIVDEAYGQFSPYSAQEFLGASSSGQKLAVVRTFSKTWAMAGVRLGYVIASPETVQVLEAVALPYHLSSLTQMAGLLALDFEEEMNKRVALITEERGRVFASLQEMALQVWPSDANFVLFRPENTSSEFVWEKLLERGILIRDCSTWKGLEGCLRVTIGTTEENGRFLDAIGEIVQ